MYDLLYNEEHEGSKIQQHTDMYKDSNDNNKSKLSKKIHTQPTKLTRHTPI